MKVLLLKDVYKLGRAGDVKKVANGYGRNYLIPQGLAVLATSEAVQHAETIREKADIQREQLNQEMDAVAERLKGVTLVFPARASETGKLYGSVTTQMIADAVTEKTGVEVTRRQIDSQPLRNLGEHTVPIRLTVDLIPEIKIFVHREGEAVVLPSEVDIEEIEAEVAEIEAEAGEMVESLEMPPTEAETEMEAEEAVESPEVSPAEAETEMEAEEAVETPEVSPAEAETEMEAEEAVETPEVSPAEAETEMEAEEAVESPEVPPVEAETEMEAEEAVESPEVPPVEAETEMEAGEMVETPEVLPAEAEEKSESEDSEAAEEEQQEAE